MSQNGDVSLSTSSIWSVVIPPDGLSAASKPSEGILVRVGVDWSVVIPPDGLSAASKPSEGIVVSGCPGPPCWW